MSSRRKPSVRLINPTSSFDIVSETWSIVEQQQPPSSPSDVSETSDSNDSGSSIQVAASTVPEDEEGRQRGILRRALITGPGTHRIMEGSQFAKLRIPSPARCLKLGYIVSYLMPGYWLIADEQWVKNSLQEQSKIVSTTPDDES